MRNVGKNLSSGTIFLLILLFLTLLIFNLIPNLSQQFSLLAKSFLGGKIYISENPGSWQVDTILIDNKHHWPLGPFPSLLLTPFVFISNTAGVFFHQGYLQYFLVLLIFYLCFKIARKFKYSTSNSIFLAIAFCFGSIFLPVSLYPVSWYFSQVTATLLILLSLFFFYKKKKMWLLIGILLGLSVATRLIALLSMTFFILSFSYLKTNLKNKMKSFSSIAVPVLLSLVLLASYNHIRFKNVWETGYKLIMLKRHEVDGSLFFNPKNIPKNFYYYFLKPPELVYQKVERKTYFISNLQFPFIKVGYPSTSFFIVSPIFLYMFRVNLKKIEVKSSILVSVIILITLLSFYHHGWFQTGPRYLLDLLPFLYIILLYSFPGKKLNNFTKTLIIASSFFNLYLFITFLKYHATLI